MSDCSLLRAAVCACSRPAFLPTGSSRALITRLLICRWRSCVTIKVKAAQETFLDPLNASPPAVWQEVTISSR
ncbi:hypothetical protein GOP47_0018542 [Adiantum capillus-veneris]|uniref:Uncharacterized protein n=1 Tax=Adiantum capillus-veneris TaxID=13818 RepID=A0A9D4Z890_ADICA|nr:hypothetical protein GOP47_0018542 [Adiantum capillus-veneris]